MGDASDIRFEETERGADYIKGNLYLAPHADHYRKLKPEPITVIEDWNLNFNLGNALKYIARANHKGTKHADLEKAIWYIQRELATWK